MLGESESHKHQRAKWSQLSIHLMSMNSTCQGVFIEVTTFINPTTMSKYPWYHCIQPLLHLMANWPLHLWYNILTWSKGSLEEGPSMMSLHSLEASWFAFACFCLHLTAKWSSCLHPSLLVFVLMRSNLASFASFLSPNTIASSVLST